MPENPPVDDQAQVRPGHDEADSLSVSQTHAEGAEAGAAYGRLISAELAYERSRSTTLEARAIGQMRVAEAQIAMMAAQRKANAVRTQQLVAAAAAEMVAVIFLSWAVATIVYGS